MGDREGGTSLFADGFALAEELRAIDPEAFEILTSLPVQFEFRDAECHLSAQRLMVELGPAGEFAAIHYNNRSLAALRLPLAQLREFYRVYRHFALLLRDERFVSHTDLLSGELAAFDNRRVLHGRGAFASGSRHLQGCYVDRDGLLSNIAVLEKRPAETHGPG
jgi:gamma-butyrobetaine dioxygenase